RLGIRLAVAHAADIDVEHVDLAVDGPLLSVGSEQDTRVSQLLVAVDALDDAPRDEPDAELARCLGSPRQRRPIERLRARPELLGRPEQVELLGQRDQLAAVRGGGAYERVRGFRIALLVLGGVELYGRNAHD